MAVPGWCAGRVVVWNGRTQFLGHGFEAALSGVRDSSLDRAINASKGLGVPVAEIALGRWIHQDAAP